jgi:hypothetical protein
MNPQFRTLTTFASFPTLTLFCCLGCSGGNKFSYQDVSVNVTPIIPSIAVNGTQTFTATVNDAPDYPIWYLDNITGTAPNGAAISINAGTIVTASTDAPTMTYTAPPTPPIYTADRLANGAVQGSVTLIAAVHSSPTNFFPTAIATQTFVITAPSVTVAISPATVSLPVGGAQQFTAYAVGSINAALTWQVSGVAGGTSASGSITTSGLYTAPTAAPITGNTITIAAVSQADTTKSASSVVTLTSH